MSIARTLALAFAVATAATALANPAQAADPRHYSGEVVCGDSYFAHVIIEDGDWTKVALRARGLDDVTDTKKGRIQQTGDDFIMTEGTRPLYMKGSFRKSGAEIAATLLNADGEPDKACRSAVFTRLERLPAAHYEALNAALAVPEPSLEQAQAAAQLLRIRPGLDFVAEIERPAALEKLKIAKADFWKRFWTVETARQAAMPAASDDDLDKLAARVLAATGEGMSPEDTAIVVGYGYADDPASSSAMFAMTADRRRADHQFAFGQTPTPLTFGGIPAACDRLTNASHVVSVEGLETVFGLPADYMQPAALDIMRAEIKACAPTAPASRESFYPTMLATIESEKATIEKRVAGRNWLEAERNRMLALPRGVEGLKASAGYTLVDDDVRSREINEREANRFFERGIAPLRLEAVTAAKGEIDALFGKAAPNAPEEVKVAAICADLVATAAIDEHCRAQAKAYAGRIVAALVADTLAKMKQTPDGFERLKLAPRLDLPTLESASYQSDINAKLYEAGDGFKQAAQPLYAAAVVVAKAQIEKAYAEARPNEPSEVVAEALCQGEMRIAELSEPCAIASQAYQGRRETLVCDARLAQSQASAEMVASRFGFPATGGKTQVVAGRAVICQVGQFGLLPEFEDNSGLFAKGLRLKLKLDPQLKSSAFPLPAMLPGGAGFQVLFSAGQDATGPYWQLDTVADAEGNSVPSLLMPREMFSCFIGNVC